MIDVWAVAVLRTSPLSSISPVVSPPSSLVVQAVCELFLKVLVLSGRQSPKCLTHLSETIPLDLHVRTTKKRIIFYFFHEGWRADIEAITD